MTTQATSSGSALSPASNVFSQTPEPAWWAVGTDGKQLGSYARARTPVGEVGKVIYVVPAPEKANLAEFVDLESEFASLAETDRGALAEGRKWVATAFYVAAPTLASLRLAAGLSQRQLGEQLISRGGEIQGQSHVSRYESGKTEPSISRAALLAEALGVDLATFYIAWRRTRELAEAK